MSRTSSDLLLRFRQRIRRHNGIAILYFGARSLMNRLQRPVLVDFFGERISVPRRHPLKKMFQEGPRDSLLILVSRYCFDSDQNHYLDVGANVGDSAIIIERHSKELLSSDLIEPSAFFFSYLERNSRFLHSPILHNAFASTTFPTQPIEGILYQWPGNAEVLSVGSHVVADISQQINIANLISSKTGLVKIDCEGLDVQILNAAVGAGFVKTPVLYFECTIRSEESLNQLRKLFASIGEEYTMAILADPNGLILYHGDVGPNLWLLFKYQLDLGKLGRQSNLYYFDVALFPRSKTDAFEKAAAEMLGGGTLSVRF